VFSGFRGFDTATLWFEIYYPLAAEALERTCDGGGLDIETNAGGTLCG
jgi:hypothetical protein